jgi:enolase-phosphatase E1
MPKAILTDIEGTISSISFVKDVLFPYASERIEDFILTNFEHDPVLLSIIEATLEELKQNKRGENAEIGVLSHLDGRVAKRTSSRLRRTNDRSVLNVHEDHEDDENAEIGVLSHLDGRVAKRTSSRLRRTNDRSVLNVHEDHEDDENAEIGVLSHLDGRVAKRTSSRLRRTNDRSVLNVHEDHEDDENAEIGVSLHAQDAVFETQVYTAIQALKTWSLEDKKITPLKDLQGLIWQEGFRKGLFKAPLYQDALDFFLNMKGKGLPIYVYSSGSIQAQRLFFEFSEFGDIRYLFSGFYDTKIGSKKEYESYLKIADDIKVSPEHILFLTDIKDECRASERAGLLTVQVVREALKDTENLDKSASSNNSIERTRKVINDFSELSEIL